MKKITRLEMMKKTAFIMGAATLASAVTGRATAQAPRSKAEPFGYCLNLATLPREGLDLAEQCQVVAEAGYSGIEPWLRDIENYIAAGGSLDDLRKRLEDWNMGVEGAIGFAPWAVDDNAKRAEGLVRLRHDMELVAKLGGTRIAAPPAGASREAITDLDALAERYSATLDLGRETGVTPQLEIWGSSKTLYRVEQAVYVAAAAGEPDAGLLLDVYHVFRGGSDFDSLRMINGKTMHAFHMNDYPATPARAEMTDAHRVYPGDGVAPLDALLRTLEANGFRGALSLELFNREYWKRPPAEVARTGLARMRATVQHALK